MARSECEVGNLGQIRGLGDRLRLVLHRRWGGYHDRRVGRRPLSVPRGASPDSPIDQSHGASASGMSVLTGVALTVLR